MRGPLELIKHPCRPVEEYYTSAPGDEAAVTLVEGASLADSKVDKPVALWEEDYSAEPQVVNLLHTTQ